MNYVNIDVNEKVKNHKEIEGLGVSYTYDDKKIKIGNNKMFDIKRWWFFKYISIYWW